MYLHGSQDNHILRIINCFSVFTSFIVYEQNKFNFINFCTLNRLWSTTKIILLQNEIRRSTLLNLETNI